MSHDSSSPNTPPRGPAVISGVFLLIALILSVREYRAQRATPDPTPIPTPAPHYQPAPAVPTQARRLYLFADYPNGVITVDVHIGEVDFYPKGGEVLITPPPPLKPWKDKPGTINPRRKFIPGKYNIQKSDPDAIGIEVWN